MIELVKKLIEENGYNTSEIDLPVESVYCYVGDEFSDIIVVAECSRNEIIDFFKPEQEKASRIMGIYEQVAKSDYSDSAKDILLVVCYQVESPASVEGDDELRHQIMRLEENKFGMRISVLKYTSAALDSFDDEDGIAMAITSKIDSNAEQTNGNIEVDKTIDAALKVEPTFTALQLYTKLPFLSLRKLVPQASIAPIEERFRKCIGESQGEVNRILALDKNTYNSWTTEELLADIDRVAE